MDSAAPELGRPDSSLSKETTPIKLEPCRYSNTNQLSATTPGLPTSPTQTDSQAEEPSKEVPCANTKQRRLIKYWILSSIAFCIIAPLISILLGFFLHTKGLSYIPPSGGFAGRNLSISAFLVSADPTSSIITFDWGVDSDTCVRDSKAVGECTDVSIFFDNNLLDNSDDIGNGVPSSDVPSTPLFRFNATASSSDFRSNTPTFRTNIRLFQSGSPRRLSLVNYPFDTYAANIFMYAQDSNNKSVNLHLDVVGGTAVGFTASLLYIDQSNFGLDAEIIATEISVRRGALIIAFCIIITIAIWIITLALFLLSFTAVVFGFRQRTEVLIIPVATVFAFTQLRASMPGAPPGFDFVGLLPCLGILSFSCALTLGALLITDPTQKEELTWKMVKPEILPALGIKKRASYNSSGGNSSGVESVSTA
ncbi:hypothetical protein JR316_0007800 [Psilocybe cubensis]|uniref:Uncharacterized protein n=2 Tax=Psilocybe cubensis TaxID=181762 RepID=A0A8H7XRM4_PSICU|nr:hypothetical protein JR316_0007800 [Psilocybe cubensis]KAH9479213.1 hypothetical protein JR316_0007800 [Psilocybe cubensis]